MRRAASLLCLALFVAGCGPERGDRELTGPLLTASLSPDSAGLGDPVRLHLEAVVPRPMEPTLPIVGDSIGAWTILDAGEWKRTRGEDWLLLEREVVLTGLRLGWLGPDSLRLLGVGAAGETLRLVCEAPGLYVGGQIAEGAPVDPKSARDIQDVVSLGGPLWPWIVAGLLLLLLGTVLVIRHLRKDARKEERLPEVPTISPEEEFERAIAKLLASGLLEKGLYREFYYGVSRAARLYLERIHDLPLLESTSEELVRLLAPKIPDPDTQQALRRWRMEGDLVKYARMERLQAEAIDYLERTKALVRMFPKPMLCEQPSRESGEPGLREVSG